MDSRNGFAHGFTQRIHPVISFNEVVKWIHARTYTMDSFDWLMQRMHTRGFIQQTHAKGSHNGFIRWPHTVDSHSGFVQWIHKIDSSDGFMQWIHSSLLLGCFAGVIFLKQFGGSVRGSVNLLTLNWNCHPSGSPVRKSSLNLFPASVPGM